MKKKAFMIVPHQDDEINLAGNIIDKILREYELYILYSSLDKREKEGAIRKKEALAACSIFGIDGEHIIFLKYPDTSNAAGCHYYSDGDLRIVGDIKKLLLDLKPDLIFATDFDYHSDHRMLSLAFDTAMGQILNEQRDYRPSVLKGFCYETAYYGKADYKASRPGKTLPVFAVLSNSSLEWENRLSILSSEKAGFIWKRRAYKALKCHRSQYAVLHARSVINADNVFWLKRTDNLIFSSSVTVSAGVPDKLYDFKTIDTQDIITLDPRAIDYSAGVWFPKEKSEIVIKWEKSVVFDRIIFHGNPNWTENARANIDIIADGVRIGTVREIREYGRDTLFRTDLRSVSEITIRINSYAFGFGLSEIEVLKGEPSFPGLIDDAATETEKENKFLDIMDAAGYKVIVFFTRGKRKVRNTLKALWCNTIKS